MRLIDQQNIVCGIVVRAADGGEEFLQVHHTSPLAFAITDRACASINDPGTAIASASQHSCSAKRSSGAAQIRRAFARFERTSVTDLAIESDSEGKNEQICRSRDPPMMCGG